MKTAIAAYLAGFFDGEGFITIYRNVIKTRYRKCPAYMVAIEVSQKYDIRPLRLLKFYFSGTLRKRKNGRWQYTSWSIYAREDVMYFLRTLIPFLIIKRTQATLALRFFSVKDKLININKGESKQLEGLRERMKSLKIVSRT